MTTLEDEFLADLEEDLEDLESDLVRSFATPLESFPNTLICSLSRNDLSLEAIILFSRNDSLSLETTSLPLSVSLSLSFSLNALGMLFRSSLLCLPLEPFSLESLARPLSLSYSL